MSLRFILGRAGSGKSHYCLEEIKRKIDEGYDKPLIYLVPEQFSFQAEKNLLHKVGAAGIGKTEVMSFRRMAYRVMNEVGGITRQHMNSAGANMLIYRILDENKENLSAFLKASRKQGFISNISATIKELKKYEISPQMLRETSQIAMDETLKGKLQDVGMIFDAFQGRLSENYIDAEDELSLLYEKLPESKIFNDAEIFMDEFFSFTPQEYSIIERLLKKAERLNVTLSMEGLPRKGVKTSEDLFLPTKNTEEKLINIAADNNIALDIPVKLDCSPCYRFRKSTEMDYMEKNLYTFPYKSFEGKTEKLSILKAGNGYGEVEEIARDILELCRDKNFRFNDIAVISGNLDGYEKLVRVIFSEHGIPYFIDKKREVNGNPIIVFLVSALEILSKNWSYEPVFRFLKCGLIHMDMNDIDLLENYVLANGIRGKRWTQNAPWDYRINYGTSDEKIGDKERDILLRVNESRNKIIKPLMVLDEALEHSKDAREMCTALYNFLCDMNISERIQNLIEKFKSTHELDKVNEYSQIWEIVIKVLEQVVEVMGDEVIDIEKLASVLSIGFEEYEVGLIPPSLDQVLVGSIQRLRSHEIKILYIIGVNDGIFPSPSEGDVIFNDEDRERLKVLGVEIAKDSKGRAFEEQFLVYTTMTTPGEFLKLSYPIADNEGKTLRPSLIISRLKKIFPLLKEKSDIKFTGVDEEKLKHITSPDATFGELITAFRASSEGREIQPLWLDVYRWFKGNEEWKGKLDTILSGFTYSNEAEIVDTSKVRSLYGRHLNLSVSRLEKYSECPFGYFVQYGLRAKERKIYRLTRPDMGTFMHDILYDFSKLIDEKDIKWKDVTDELCVNEVSAIIDKKVSDMPSSVLNSSARYRHAADAMKKIVSRAVWIVAKHMKRGDFTPAGYELAFGEDGNYPPIVVKLHSGESVYLIGRIDRVDMLSEDRGNFIRIIDYKSGTKEFKLTDVYNGLQLQLLVYLDAILTDMSKEIKGDMLPGGMFYLRMDDPIIKSSGEISDDKIEEEIIKKLKLNGLLLSDEELVRHMDNSISGSSSIIPAKLNKDNTLSKVTSGATLEQFNMLRRYVRDTIAEICEEILEGKIDLMPCKKNKYTPCTYCSFSAVCQFDTHIKGNKYKYIEDKDNEEIWTALKEKYGSTSGVEE